MKKDKKFLTNQGLWNLGNTSANWSQNEFSDRLKLFVEILKTFEFDTWSGNEKIQTEFSIALNKTDYWNIKQKLPDNARKQTTTPIKLGLFDDNRKITPAGIDFSNSEYPNEYLSFSKKLNMDKENLFLFFQYIKTDFKGIDFRPLEEMFILLLQNVELKFYNIGLSRFANTREEFIQAIKYGKPPSLLTESRQQEWNAFNYNEYFKSRKSEKKYFINFNLIIQNIENNFSNNYETIYKKLIEIHSITELNKLKIKEFINFIKLDKIKTHDLKKEYFIWLQEQRHIIPSYKSYSQQFKILMNLLGFIDIKKNSFKLNKEFIFFFKSNKLVHSNKPKNETSLLSDHFRIRDLEVYINIVEDLVLEKAFSFLEEDNNYKLIGNKEIKKQKKFPKELILKKDYVLAEYFTILRLCKIFSLDIKKFRDYSSLKLSKDGSPLSHAPGKVPDIIIPLKKKIFEVTTSFGRTSEKLELEPVVRHLCEYNSKNNTKFKGVFISNEPISKNIISHFIKTKKWYDKNEKEIPISIIPISFKDLSLINKNNYEKIFSNLFLKITNPDMTVEQYLKEKNETISN